MTAPDWPDVADVLCDLLAQFGTCGTETDDRLGEMLPFVEIHLIGGSDDRVTDTSTVDVDVYVSAGKHAAVQLAGQIRQFLLAGPHVINGVVLDRFGTVIRPRPLPHVTPGIFRASATYRAAARRAA